MSASEKTVIAMHNMENYAVGLASFIKDQWREILVDDKPMIYIMDEEGNHVKQARLVEVTLDNGSKVYNLVLTMDS